MMPTRLEFTVEHLRETDERILWTCTYDMKTKCLEENVDLYDTKTNGQKGVCMRQLYNFTTGKKDDPVEDVLRD